MYPKCEIWTIKIVAKLNYCHDDSHQSSCVLFSVSTSHFSLLTACRSLPVQQLSPILRQNCCSFLVSLTVVSSTNRILKLKQPNGIQPLFILIIYSCVKIPLYLVCSGKAPKKAETVLNLTLPAFNNFVVSKIQLLLYFYYIHSFRRNTI